MAIDSQSIESKLDKLEEINKYLRKYQEISQDDFSVDFTVNAAAMHYIVQGIEIVMDIGNHLLKEKYHVNSKNYREIIENLGEYEIIPEELAQENVDMAGFRNVVIHDYEDINMNRVYETLQRAPEVFEEFSEHYSKFL